MLKEVLYLTKKNFLIFIVDQMQWQSLAINGNPDVKTPNIDKLGHMGVNFNRSYCANPVCMPSRSSIITGLLPRQHGCISNGRNLDMKIPTLGSILKNHGYKTHAIHSHQANRTNKSKFYKIAV